MADFHTKTFFGQKSSLVISSPAKIVPYIFLSCINRKEDGTWGVPVNLGKNINSRDDEDAPFIHPNKTYLFFTSNGHKTMGGYDIFRSELKNDVWGKPINMGYPVNSPADDNYFTLIADGSGGYFSSDRKGGKGGQDIYRMDMPEDFETIPLTMIKGRILEAETERPLDTKIYMIDNETKEKLDYEDFLTRLEPEYKRLEILNVKHRKPE